MCVIFFYVNSNPVSGGYKLILASNRDEFYARRTREVAKWVNAEPIVYGGIDLEPGREGGTWLAVSGHKGVFKVGALLNLTGEPRPKNAAGRGMIVSNFVTADCTIEDYNRTLVADCTKFSAFNFVSIEIGPCRNLPARITLCSNIPAGLEHYDEGKCYGFGNSLPSKPFGKVLYGQQRFQSIVDDFHAKQRQIDTSSKDSKGQDELIRDLQNLLKYKQKFWPDAELQRRAPHWGENLSALNVNIPDEGYGSRTHTIILIDANDKMHFVEETMAALNPDGKWLETHIEKQYFKNDQA